MFFRKHPKGEKSLRHTSPTFFNLNSETVFNKSNSVHDEFLIHDLNNNKHVLLFEL